MVIHQFNKLIRNKWVWGVFAIAISAFFAFDFLIADLDRSAEDRNAGSSSTLGGQTIDRDLFGAIVDDVRGRGQQRDLSRDAGEVNRTAGERYAALEVAGKNGLGATDADVRSSVGATQPFMENGAFSFDRYQMILRQHGLLPEQYEAMLKREMTLQNVGRLVLPAAGWVSPMELDQAVADRTDTFTVKVAKFEQSKKDADAVKLDEAGLKKWYEDNKASLELPERIKIRYVRFNAADTNVLAKMLVSEEAVTNRYDESIAQYTTTDTNGVDHVKKLEEVRAVIERELRLEAAVECFETNLRARAFAEGGTADCKSRLDQIAREEKLTVATSDWFALEGGYQEGFMKRASQILPGAKDFTDVIAEVNPESEDFRYGIVKSERAVWLVEQAAKDAKHVPTYEEAKEAIRPRALRDAKADAFKASVEAVAAKGPKAVVALKDVSTNIVFSVRELMDGGQKFDNQYAVVRAAVQLKKGEVSKFTQTGTGKAILVVCEDRKPGSAADAMLLRSQVRSELGMMYANVLPASWMKWNLDRIGFEADAYTSVETGVEEE